jgi:hypothetical protein
MSSTTRRTDTARRGTAARRTAVTGPAASSEPAARYFVTGPNIRVQRAIGGAVSVLSGGPFHAKVMGTTSAACGASSTSWVKVWDVPFALTPQPACRECVDAVAASSSAMRTIGVQADQQKTG